MTRPNQIDVVLYEDKEGKQRKVANNELTSGPLEKTHNCWSWLLFEIWALVVVGGCSGGGVFVALIKVVQTVVGETLYFPSVL